MARPEKLKTKIIFVITKGNWGGAQRYVYDLVTALPKNRFQTAVILGDGTELKQHLAEAGIAYYNLPRLKREVKLFSDLIIGWHLYRFFRRERPAIVHLNSSKIGGLGAFAGRLASVPKIIFTAHGWPFQERRSFAQRLVIKFLSWLTVRLAHQTIVVAESEKTLTRRWLGTKNKIVTIHNGIKEFTRLERGAARRELKLTDDKLVIGTIAELTKNKGLGYLILALPNIPKANLIVIGEGKDRSDLTQLTNRQGLDDRVRLNGHISNAARLLPAFDIFVLPSIKEGLPYVLLEAGLAGLPVVTSAVGGIPEIVTSMESGILIKPRDPSEIAKAVNFLISHPDKRTEFAHKLRQKIKHGFSTARMVKQTLEVYTSQL